MEKHIEKIVDLPVEIIVERDVIYDRTVDKEIRRTILKPKRTEIQTNEIIEEIIVPEDIIIEKKIERPYNTIVEVPITEYVDREYIT